MNRCFSITITGVAFFLLGAISALGQSAQLDGVVRDATDLVVPGAEVTLTNNANNLSTSVITSDNGRYIFVNVRPGSYTLAAELPGFKRVARPNVILEVGSTLTLHLKMEVGEITDEIIVDGEPFLRVDRTTPKIGGVVDEQQMTDLPLSTRNVMELVFVQPGANRVSEGGDARFNGLRNTTSNVQVEGIAANDPFFTGGATQSRAPVIVEAMAEYSVTTSSATADAGSGSGAQVQLIYKSGTNEFHGSVWEFHRNRALNANNFFSNRGGFERPTFLRHQYGFAMGGPIIKNRAFFHFTYENTTQKIDELRQPGVDGPF